MDLRVLGPLTALRQGEPVPLGGPRQRAVLALLVLRANTVVATDRLLDDLYGDDPPPAARKSLQSFIANLRRAVNQDGEILVGRSPGYVLQVDSDVVDLLRFEQLVDQARELQREDPAAARELLTEALDLWRGVPFVDVAGESPLLELESMRLEDARLDAVELRIEMDLALGERAPVVGELETLTTDHPLRERFWAQLMLALYGAGRQAEALRTYQRARRILGEELGIEPAPELVELENRILLQDPDLGPVLGDGGAASVAEQLAPGRTLHGYEIRQVAARGAAATLYRAYQATLGREVALTAIAAEAADKPDLVRRFEAEMRSLGSGDAPGSVAVIDAWRQPGAAYLVTVGDTAEGIAGIVGAASSSSILDSISQYLKAGAGEGSRSQVANPYRGLRAFGENDAALFYGREQLTRKLVGRVGESSFVSLVGPSGSGKSSVLHAGLLPALRSGAHAGAEEWLLTTMVPGTAPFEELAAALTRIALSPVSHLGERLRRDVGGFDVVLQDLVGSRPVLLVIDQFEELYTLVRNDEERRCFLDLLLGIATGNWEGVRVVIGLRADYFDRPLAHSGLGEIVSDATETVVPLTGVELEQAITGPAGVVGLTFESGLVARIVADVVDQPGALPLLQHALSELFEHRTGSDLTQAAYEAIGGVGGALGRRAESIFQGLTAMEREAARQIMLRLVAPDERGSMARRRAMRSELTSLGGSRASRGVVLEAFGRHRLLSFDRDPATRSPTVELAHEALTLAWPRFRDWIETSRADLAQQRRLATAVTEWLESDRDPGYLLSGGRLVHFEEWAGAPPVSLTTVETEYLDASRAARDRSEAAEQARADHEAELERRSQRRLRVLVWVMAIAVLAVGTLALIARSQATEAQRNLAVSEAQRLTAQATEAVSSDPELAILLALAAADRIDDVGEPILAETIEVLHVAIPANRMVRSFPAGATAFSPDGTTLAAADPGTTLSGAPGPGIVTLFDAVTGDQLQVLEGHSARTYTTAFSPDGTVIASGGYDGTVRLWDAAGGGALGTMQAGPGLTAGIAFHPVDDELLTTSVSGYVRSWTLSGELVAEYRQPAVSVESAYLPDGRIAVAVDDPGHGIYLWQPGATEPTGLLAHPLGACAVTLDPTGELLATSGSDGIVRLWDAATLEPGMILEGHGGRVCGLAFVPARRLLVSASEDGTLRVWDTVTGTTVMSLVGHTAGVEHVAVSPDGRWVASGSGAGTTRIWDISAAGSREWLTVAAGSGPGVAAAFSPDGNLLATADQDGTGAVWDAVSGELISSLRGHTSAAWFVAFDPAGEQLITSSQDSTAVLWDAISGNQLHVLEGHQDQVFGVAFSTDGDTVYTAGFDSVVRAWGTADGDERWQIPAGGRGVFGIDVDDDGSRLVTSGDEVVVWDLETRERVFTLPSDLGVTTAVSFTPSGGLVTGGADGALRLWALTEEGPQETAELGGHSAAITGIALDTAGTVMVSASPDGVVQVWDGDGSLRYGIRGVAAPAIIAVNPEGTRLAVPSSDGSVRVFVLDPAELIELAAQRVTRSLTAEECARFLDAERCP